MQVIRRLATVIIWGFALILMWDGYINGSSNPVLLATIIAGIALALNIIVSWVFADKKSDE